MDELNHRWESRAEFRADAYGVVDVTAQAPVAGTYREVDAMGLFWSMELDPAVTQRSVFDKASAAPINVELLAEVEGGPSAKIVLSRLLLAARIRRTSVRENGLVGTLFHDYGGPRPAVIVIGGSGGGLDESIAALLASHGYTTLALAYFGCEGLPPLLRNIPLEYFETAIQWIKRHPSARAGKVAVMGRSRGGELALLLGSTFPAITAVVAVAPSSVMWQSVERELADEAGPSWTYHGQPLPFVVRAREASPKPPIELTAAYLKAMRNETAMERAAIAVEKINGPILMVSGKDDLLWPAATFAERVMDRLKRHNFPHSYKHLTYDDSGHFGSLPPFRPTTLSEMFHPVDRASFALGGTARGDASASVSSWREMLAFFEDHHT
jgi:dienelactone hydrolase